MQLVKLTSFALALMPTLLDCEIQRISLSPELLTDCWNLLGLWDSKNFLASWVTYWLLKSPWTVRFKELPCLLSYLLTIEISLYCEIQRISLSPQLLTDCWNLLGLWDSKNYLVSSVTYWLLKSPWTVRFKEFPCLLSYWLLKSPCTVRFKEFPCLLSYLLTVEISLDCEIQRIFVSSQLLTDCWNLLGLRDWKNFPFSTVTHFWSLKVPVSRGHEGVRYEWVFTLHFVCMQ
jgi:hypothetical protein